MAAMYFQPVPCASNCFKCPYTLASSSRLDLEWSDSDSFIDNDAFDVEVEWAQEMGGTFELELDPEVQGPEPWSQKHPFHVADDKLRSMSWPRTLPANTAVARNRAVRTTAMHSDEDLDYTTPEMPPCYKARSHRLSREAQRTRHAASIGKPRTSSIQCANRRSRNDIAAPILFPRASDWPQQRQELDPMSEPVGDHGYMTESSIRDWIATVNMDTNRATPLPAPSEVLPLPSQQELQVPSDITTDGYSADGEEAPSSTEHITLALRFEQAFSTMSNDRSPLRRIEASSLPQRGRNLGSLDLPTECIDDWRSLMGEALSSQSFYNSSPGFKDRSSTMFSTNAEATSSHTFPLDSTMFDSPNHWADVGEQHEFYNLETSSPMDFELEVVCPRSMTPSDLDFNLHPMQPPPILDSEDFSRLMSRTFMSPSSSSLGEQNEARSSSDQMELGNLDPEVEHADAAIACHFDDFDFMDSWSPPALRSSSSASSQDPFHLEIFSPTSDQTDGAAIWNSEERDQQEMHVARPSSESPDFFSSSSFLGWSSSSVETGTKPESSRVGTSAYEPKHDLMFAITLHQPQPIRAIPHIDAELLLDEFPELFS